MATRLTAAKKRANLRRQCQRTFFIMYVDTTNSDASNQHRRESCILATKATTTGSAKWEVHVQQDAIVEVIPPMAPPAVAMLSAFSCLFSIRLQASCFRCQCQQTVSDRCIMHHPTRIWIGSHAFPASLKNSHTVLHKTYMVPFLLSYMHVFAWL
jgi:hypothetical protein